MQDKKCICVFCSSSDMIGSEYRHEARLLGEEMARRGHSLVYGGGAVGAMGVLAHALQDAGGRVMGVIPHALNQQGVGYEGADELIITENMRQRKAIMEENADAFIALPGGLGTLEELLEIVTLKQLHYHTKPVVILNSTGYYDPLLAVFDSAVRARFIKGETLALFHVSDSVHDALGHIETYQPHVVSPKWVREMSPERQTDVAVE